MGYGAGRPKNTFVDYGTQAIGSIGETPTRSDPTNAVANILNVPLTAGNDYTDLTGNHTLSTGNAILSPTYGYNAEQQMYTDDGSGAVVRTNASEPEHAIGGTDPVTFGFFFQPNFWNSTSNFMTSSNSGGNGANYGLIRFTNGNWGFRGDAGGGEGQAWRTMVNRSPEDNANVLRWFHVAMRCEDGVNEGTFFWNGREVWSGALGSNGRKTANSIDQLQFNDAKPNSNNPRFRGYWGNVFIADSALTDAQIRQLSDESFGHGSPQTAF